MKRIDLAVELRPVRKKGRVVQAVSLSEADSGKLDLLCEHHETNRHKVASLLLSKALAATWIPKQKPDSVVPDVNT